MSPSASASFCPRHSASPGTSDLSLPEGGCTSSPLGLHEGSKGYPASDRFLAMLGLHCAAPMADMGASSDIYMNGGCCLSGLSVKPSALLKEMLWIVLYPSAKLDWRCKISSLMGSREGDRVMSSGVLTLAEMPSHQLIVIMQSQSCRTRTTALMLSQMRSLWTI